MSAQVVGSQPKQTGFKLIPVLNRKQRIANFPFVLILVGLLGAGMMGVVVLATFVQARFQTLSELRQQAVVLEYRQAALEAEVAEANSTQNLSYQAWELGMRPNLTPVFLQLSDGTVLGAPTAVSGTEMTHLKPDAMPGQVLPNRQGADEKEKQQASDNSASSLSNQETR